MRKKKKKEEKKEPKPDNMEVDKTATPPKVDTTSPKSEPEKAPSQELKDHSLASPMDTPMLEEAPAILQTGTQLKEVELKHLDSWSKLDWTDSSSNQPLNDETWSQFKNLGALSKQREKEREEQERKEKLDREAERKKQEEQRLKDLTDAEEKKRREEEDEKNRQKDELLAKREAERKARQQMSARIQEQKANIDDEFPFDEQPGAPIRNMFKLKEDDLPEANESVTSLESLQQPARKEDGEL